MHKENHVKNIVRRLSILAVLVATLGFNAVPVAQALPCTDRYNGCMSGGGGYDYCDGMWCGCMYSTYGSVC